MMVVQMVVVWVGGLGERSKKASALKRGLLGGM